MPGSAEAATGMSLLDARPDGHTLRWHPFEAEPTGVAQHGPYQVQTISPRWRTPARFEDVPSSARLPTCWQSGVSCAATISSGPRSVSRRPATKCIGSVDTVEQYRADAHCTRLRLVRRPEPDEFTRGTPSRGVVRSVSGTGQRSPDSGPPGTLAACPPERRCQRLAHSTR